MEQFDDFPAARNQFLGNEMEQDPKCWLFYSEALLDLSRQNGGVLPSGVFQAEDIGQVFTYVKHYMSAEVRKTHTVDLLDKRVCMVICSHIDPRIYVVWPEHPGRRTLRIQGFEGQGNNNKNMGLFVCLDILIQIGRNAN